VSKEVKKEDIYGIGFDATCSLVVLDANEHPLQVNNDCKLVLLLFHVFFQFHQECFSNSRLPRNLEKFDKALLMIKALFIK